MNKTNLTESMNDHAIRMIAAVQASGGVCAVIDFTGAFDTTRAISLGVKLEDLLVSQPSCLEQADEILDTLVRTGAIDLIVVDSPVSHVFDQRTTTVVSMGHR